MALRVTARCVDCGARRPDEGVLYTCPDCGGNLDLIQDWDALRGDPAALKTALAARLAPLRKISPTAWNSGGTPLLTAQRLGGELGMTSLFLKDETRNLSASLKDRASELVLMRALELGLSTVAAASTGNAGASLAALAARFGLDAVIFAPRSAPVAKLRQIQAHGARLYLVDGNYDRAFELCLEAVRERGWYSRNTGHNPWCGEGKKSVALEIADQMRTHPPDYVFVPVGDGCIIGAVYKGFADLRRLGLLERMPRIVAVQAEGSAAITQAWRALAGRPEAADLEKAGAPNAAGDSAMPASATKPAGDSAPPARPAPDAWRDAVIEPVRANTLADSISVDLPRDARKALRAVCESNGFAITVMDAEILAALRDLARLEGLFAEPAAAASVAGLRKALAEGLLARDARVVCLITGSGLKDRDALAPLLEEPPLIMSLEDLP